MKDILTMIYQAITEDEELMSMVSKRNIKFNDYPEVMSITEPYIVIDDFDDPMPEVYFDGEQEGYSYIVQVDVFVKATDRYNARLKRNAISQRINKVLWDNYLMGQVTNLGNEYNKDFALYRSTRRYEAIFYEEEN
ncbi:MULTISPECIES: hypothetical protein [unclassified Staphylococcus]|uniref:hypothetical protein n=1 Tax=unclassified Staphylococcus TaxID=91994 RepID=UPI0008A372A2|nr:MULTISPECIES: hypothetical protein [unclassified Staphylococcus]OFV05204.1 hypothetical protein HMPREF3124_08215 [Staphylococcus sp. HMSC12H08]OHR51744.1 hypothetical protein HMPREF2951_08585 [Staphylococcus sp. HMSC056D08]OHS50491.1 hypothetical protein HMPREF3270_00275 [Staphylococcus sp. HMSC65H10]